MAAPSIHPCSSSSSSWNPVSNFSAFGGLYRLRPKETTAAISKIISVISCKASQTNWRNVLGGFGGIVLDPNTSLLASRSDLSPRVPCSSDVLRAFSSPRRPPISLSFWTPSAPRNSINSRSCLSDTPKRFDAMVIVINQVVVLVVVVVVMVVVVFTFHEKQKRLRLR